MNDNHRDLIGIGLTLGIVALALFIIQRFIPSLVWASIIAIATYPVYVKFKKIFGKNENISAFIFTTIFTLILAVPFSWLVSLLIKEMQLLINYLQHINRVGGEAPAILHEVPYYGKELVAYWDENIGTPGHMKTFLANLHMTLTPASYYLKRIGMSIAHRSFQFGFTLLTLFFFYRDGEIIFKQINKFGEKCLGSRWYRYANKLPKALRGTVNGTIVVGLGVGILMGGCYELVGVPAPTLVGFITAFAAMIPFVVPIVFAFVALMLIANTSFLAAFIVVVWGTLVMFVADHFVKPVLIGGTIQLPFLAVLFGILGGVETLGLLGLFVGPIIMVLFYTLWQESQS